jgi:hypothetical protein
MTLSQFSISYSCQRLGTAPVWIAWCAVARVLYVRVDVTISSKQVTHAQLCVLTDMREDLCSALRRALVVPAANSLTGIGCHNKVHTLAAGLGAAGSCCCMTPLVPPAVPAWLCTGRIMQ